MSTLALHHIPPSPGYPTISLPNLFSPPPMVQHQPTSKSIPRSSANLTSLHQPLQTPSKHPRLASKYNSQSNPSLLPPLPNRPLQPLTRAFEDRIFRLIEKAEAERYEEEAKVERERRKEGEKWRKAVVWKGGRESAEIRCAELKERLATQLADVDGQAQATAEQILNDFKHAWKEHAVNTLLKNITSPTALPTLSYQELTYAKAGATSLSQQRTHLLHQLESALEMLEYNRAAAMEEHIMEFGRALNKVWYFSITEATRMVQEQCMESNRAMLEDRENEVKYCAAVQATSIELDRRVEKVFGEVMEQWKTLRMTFILDQIREQCKAISDGEVHKLYEDFQRKFIANVEEQNDVIRTLVTFTTPMTTSELASWRGQGLQSFHKQEVTIQDFRTSLSDVEQHIGERLDALIDEWTDKLDECRWEGQTAQNGEVLNPLSQKIIEDEVQSYRTNSQLIAGKRASLLLSAQASHNRDILTLIADFMQCVLEMEQAYKVQTQDLTVDIQGKLEEFHALYVSDYKYQEKLMYREVEEMKREKEDEAVTSRIDKCREILVAIGGLHKGFQTKAAGFMQNLSTQLKASVGVYKQKVVDSLQIGTADALTTDKPGSGPSFIGGHGIRYFLPTFASDIEFMTQFIHVWREEQQDRAQAAGAGKPGAKKDPKRKVAVREAGRAAFTRPSEAMRILSFEGTDALRRPSGTDEPIGAHGGRPSLTVANLGVAPTPEPQVVEIPPVSLTLVKDARMNFQELFVLHTERLMDAMTRESDDITLNKVAEFGNDLAETLFALEGRAAEIEEVFRKRLTELAQTRKSNETHSRVFIHKLTTLKASYSSAISQIELLATTFLSSHTHPTSARLRTCRTSAHIKLLNAQYQKHLAQHTATLNKHLNEAKEKFDKGKKELLASKVGPLKDAWELVKAVNGGKTDGVSSLDAWADQYERRLDAVQDELKADVDRFNAEVDAHLEDVGLIEAVERQLAGMRMRVKAETTKCEDIKRRLKSELADLESYRDYDTLRWDRIQTLINRTEDLRASVAAYAHYLGCVKDGNGVKFMIERSHPDFEKWKEDQKVTTPSKQAPPSQTSGKGSKAKRPTSGVKKTPAAPSATGPTQPLTFLALMQKARVEVRVGIVETCEAFYKRVGTRGIRRTNEIPASPALYMGYVDIRLNHIQEKAEQFRHDRIEEFISLLTSVTIFITTLSTKSLTILTFEANRHLTTSWKSHTTTFATALLAAKRARDTYQDHHIKVGLAYSQDAAELDRVNARGRELEGHVVKCGGEILEKWKEFTESEGRDVVERVEFVTESLAGILDQLVLNGDVERPPKMVEARTRTVREVLEAMKAQNDDKPDGTKAETSPAAKATTPDTKTYPALPVAELSFLPAFPATSRTHRSTPLHTTLYTDRDTKFLQFARDAKQKWETLQTYISNENAAHERWLADWEKSIEGVRTMRSKMAGAG
ncbi:hypothetical protein HK097_007291 [Rhizophlyctis rosea]|uniref:Uncharacterized protein n=1 Tax=Rhizophlyctis rosea TaxID=64517 RepID=A0AAD5X2C0_9FUNG|nr:hypothetical protein HK097_007291 [Rhizophlyctis rosea]